jgi:hypothetical protein
MDFRKQRDQIKINEMLMNGNKQHINEMFDDGSDDGGDLGGGGGGGADNAPYMSSGGNEGDIGGKIGNSGYLVRGKDIPMIPLTLGNVRLYQMAGKNGFGLGTAYQLEFLLQRLRNAGLNLNWGEYPPGSSRYYVVDNSTVPPTIYGHNVLHGQNAWPSTWPVVPIVIVPGDGNNPEHFQYPSSLPPDRWGEIPGLEEMFDDPNLEDFMPGGRYGDGDGRVDYLEDLLYLINKYFGNHIVYREQVIQRLPNGQDTYKTYWRRAGDPNAGYVLHGAIKVLVKQWHRLGIQDYGMWQELGGGTHWITPGFNGRMDIEELRGRIRKRYEQIKPKVVTPPPEPPVRRRPWYNPFGWNPFD